MWMQFSGKPPCMIPETRHMSCNLTMSCPDPHLKKIQTPTVNNQKYYAVYLLT